MNTIVSSKPVKLISTTLICLMLLSTIVGSRVNVVPTKAETYPWEPLTLYATKTANLHWGYYGGYQALWAGMKPMFADIGINLDTSFTTDDWSWWGRVWDVGWDKTHIGGGWDLTMLEWWLQPHALVPWFESMVYGDMAPPDGFNIYHWNNTYADEVLRRGMREHAASVKKGDIWKWQEIFMHDPPWADIYNPRIYEVVASYVTGYNPSGTWWYDMSRLRVNSSKFYDVVVSDDRRDTGPNTLIYAVSESVWNLLPLYMDTYTEEQMRCPQWNTLYKWSIKPEKWPLYELGEEVDNLDWAVVPDIALQDPVLMDGPNGPGTRARIALRDNVYWSDGVKLTANDVVFSYNPCTLSLDTGNTGYGDFVSQIEDCVYVNETAVDMILKYAVPLVDLKSCLANDWGGGVILPFHILGEYADNPGNMKHCKANTDFSNSESWLPVTGPYKMSELSIDNYVTFVKNPDYFGYDLGWGPYDIDTIIYKWVPDAETRLLELQANVVDFGEYPTGSVDTFEDMMTWPNLRVFQYDYPASNAIWFNLDHPVLSNRYVRQAIAHVVDAQALFNSILPSWGIETAYRGLTQILDSHWYTDESNVTVHLYNDVLDAYEHNSTRALKYLEMWWYAKEGEDETLGPIGDANFNGAVDMYDYYAWVENVGKLIHQVTFLPGQDLDPDWNNDGKVDGLDFYMWPGRWGFWYPENSTTHEWSR